MRFVSTRDKNNTVTFKEAVLNSIPSDGGLYVPADSENLRRWILYANETTSFASLAGALTSALINTEFSPIICETIATHAFSHDPVLKKLDDNLFVLELFHGATGTAKDFGVSYLAATLETILQMDGEKSILLDTTTGGLGASMAHALRDKKLLKSVLLYPKGKVRGLREQDFVWNGGNLYPIEVDGTEADCRKLMRSVFADRELVQKYHLTVANTANIGRLLPQSFFYTFAFSRLKKFIDGDIYYALAAGNYGNVVAGLYGWKASLPVNGFIVPTTANIKLDVQGNCTLLDSVVPVQKRTSIDPSDPSNLERLEQVFKANALILRSFVYPADVSKEQREQACKQLFMKYGVYADQETCGAYAAALARSDVVEAEDGAVVLIDRLAPAYDSAFIQHCIGEDPEQPDTVAKALAPISLDRPMLAPGDLESLISILNSLNLLRLF
ncbi:MAG: threonine synthase [Treponema sp.]|nr:threonine synthase [Treponema sp.]